MGMQITRELGCIPRAQTVNNINKIGVKKKTRWMEANLPLSNQKLPFFDVLLTVISV